MKSMNLFSGSMDSLEIPSPYANNPVLLGKYLFMLNNSMNLIAKDEEDEDADDQEEVEDLSIDDEMNNDMDLEFENDTDDYDEDDEDGNYEDYV